MLKKIAVVLIVLAWAFCAQAFESPFSVTWDAGPINIAIGKGVTTPVTIRIPAGHFLYKDKTSIDFTALEGLHVVSVKYPEAYPEGEANIYVTFKAPKTLKEGEYEVSSILGFQGCEEKLCLRPEERAINWKFKVVRATVNINEDEAGRVEEEQLNLSDLLNIRDFKKVILRGHVVAFLAAFLAGLLTSLTPCVWPLIPVTLLVIGVHKRTHVGKNLLLSMCLVGGIALTYALLGVVASLIGSNMGFLFQKKIFLVLVVLFFTAMSLSMFGLFTIELPVRMRNLLAKMGGSGYHGAFLIGISLGLLATPCVGPIIGPILLWVAKQREYLFGGFLLFVYALGMGVVYIVVGTFYGSLAGRLRSVRIGGVIKKLIGVLLLIPAIYYFFALLPNGVNGNGFKGWNENEESALVDIVALKRPMMIVFGAKWCPPCRKLEMGPLRDKNIVELSEQFVLLHVDATTENEEIKRVLDKYGIVGWPTILFVSPQGTVYDDLSIVGRVPSVEELSDIMKEALKRQDFYDESNQ